MNNISYQEVIAATLGASAGFVLVKIFLENERRGETHLTYLTIAKIKDVLTQKLIVILMLALCLTATSLTPMNVITWGYLGCVFSIPIYLTYYKKSRSAAIRANIRTELERIPTLADTLNTRVHGITPPSIGREFHLINQKRCLR